jgi:hypothetical protein
MACFVRGHERRQTWQASRRSKALGLVLGHAPCSKINLVFISSNVVDCSSSSSVAAASASTYLMATGRYSCSPCAE